MNKLINYEFFHWGPFLYKTVIGKEEVDQVKNYVVNKTKMLEKLWQGF